MSLRQSIPDRVRSRLWTLPVLIAVSSLAGLILGLVGDGIMDALGWLGLVPALLALAWAWRTRNQDRPRTPSPR